MTLNSSIASIRNLMFRFLTTEVPSSLKSKQGAPIVEAIKSNQIVNPESTTTMWRNIELQLWKSALNLTVCHALVSVIKHICMWLTTSEAQAEQIIIFNLKSMLKISEISGSSFKSIENIRKTSNVFVQHASFQWVCVAHILIFYRAFIVSVIFILLSVATQLLLFHAEFNSCNS